MSCARLAPNGDVLLKIKAVPNAPQTRFDGLYGDDALKLRVHAPPVDGAANDEIIRFLADYFDLKRRDLHLVSGEKSRDKVFSMGGTTLEIVKSQIARHLINPSR
ncbi:MAG TPA: DUF167 domain-containing protein [Bdellovibrionota bacterium]|jgi:uncharacterized protein (TIGR00251 family)|nr:DUF167 domain-containing protein [Bdellovibrionota bacterium]